MSVETQGFTLQEIVCWVNAWANRGYWRDWRRNRDYIAGYERACSEIMDVLEPLAGDWTETWGKRRWRDLSRERGET